MDKLTDQEKSVLLARAMGQYYSSPLFAIVDFVQEEQKHRWFHGGMIQEIPNFYNPVNMAISYEVIHWVDGLAADGLDRIDDFDAIINAFNDIHLPAKKWLAGWLDAIYLMVDDTEELR